jgi:hypothetical protein
LLVHHVLVGKFADLTLLQESLISNVVQVATASQKREDGSGTLRPFAL